MEQLLPQMSFRARLLNVDRARAALDDQQPTGEVDIMLALFDVPDTSVAYGNDDIQVIDRGAFKPWIARTDFEQTPVPMFQDHGLFWVYGTPLAEYKIGRAHAFSEESEGLRMQGLYNLQSERGRARFTDLLNDPNGSQFSFSNMASDERREKAPDGTQHVVEFVNGIEEASQVGAGAQRGAHLIAARRSLLSWGWEPSEVARLLNEERFRAALSEQLQADPCLVARLEELLPDVLHFRADVDQSSWDGPAAMRACDTAACYRGICAGETNQGQPDERQHWALPHHKTPGAPPNAAGVRNALSRLPQTQNLVNKQAAQAHLDRHMSAISPGRAAVSEDFLEVAEYQAQLLRSASARV